MMVPDDKDTSAVARTEGEDCGMLGCQGKLEFKPVENCACHIFAPCAACEHVSLWCPVCGWAEEM